jgi:hypothetical protein
MSGTKWMIEGREFAHCNCDYGCPCQFNALPTHGNCKAVVGLVIDKGYDGDTELDGLKAAAAFFFPGVLHEGHGEGVVAIDERATPAQREALLRILGGQDTAPGATFFQILSTVTEKLHEPLVTTIDFEVGVDGRRARLNVPGMIEARGEPILNPVTGSQLALASICPMALSIRSRKSDAAGPKTQVRSLSLWTILTPILPSCT